MGEIKQRRRVTLTRNRRGLGVATPCNDMTLRGALILWKEICPWMRRKWHLISGIDRTEQPWLNSGG